MRCLVAALLVLAGCAPGRPSAVPPEAEFLVATDDSTFWIRADAHGIKRRAAPLTLARVGGRFVELYVADDDRSFSEAVFLGQRVYARDLERGDSSAVFRDALVPPLAVAWLRAHPDDTPLDPDEPEPGHPETRAAVDIALLDVTGHWLSIEIHSDLAPRGSELVHESRRAVLDLRSGRVVALRDLAAGSNVARLIAEARAALGVARDSAARLRDERGPAALRALTLLEVDSTNFSLTAVRAQPAVQFLASAGHLTIDGTSLPLSPMVLAQPPWLTDEMRDAYATSSTGVGSGEGVERWVRPAYELLARSDTGGDVRQLALRDGMRHEFLVGSVQGAVRRVFWLDSSPVDAAARRALARAFDDATYYSDFTRTARWPRGAPAPRTRLVTGVRRGPRGTAPWHAPAPHKRSRRHSRPRT